MTLSEQTLYQRFLSKVPQGLPEKECWPWQGHIDKCTGYGVLRTSNIPGKGRMSRAHRLAYEFSVGPIPNKLTIDHLCHTRSCVNPRHLEAVTLKVNVLRGIGPAAVNKRKTHCKYGHEFTPDNIEWRKGGARHCKQCRRVAHKKYT